jgi:hypothetical protein
VLHIPPIAFSLFGFHEKNGIFCAAELLLVSQEILSSMELVIVRVCAYKTIKLIAFNNATFFDIKNETAINLIFFKRYLCIWENKKNNYYW